MEFEIVSVKGDDVKVVEKFIRPSIEEAIDYTKKYRKNHKTKGVEYLWRTVIMRFPFEKNDTWYGKCWDNITWNCWHRWITKFQEFKYERKRIKYFKKYHHDRNSAWSFDTYFLSDLRWNLTRLMNESYGVSSKFMEMAWKKKHPKKEYDGSAGNGLMVEAIEIRRDVYSNLIRLIDLYSFYAQMDLPDVELIKTNEMVEFILPLSYNVIDWKKMNARANSLWNEIINQFKVYGQGMWD